MAERPYFPDLLAGGWKDRDFEPFRAGVEICWLCRERPQLALLRYAPGAAVPRHRHVGQETILVLEGAQEDDAGRYAAGSVVINPPGTAHAVRSPEGCVVLIQWLAPVEILEDG